MGISKGWRVFVVSVFTVGCLVGKSSPSFAEEAPTSGSTPPAFTKKKIAVIGGGGAGVVSTWLLDESYDVTLYEISDRLGGHADTIPVKIGGKTYPMDAGFEFINQTSFPQFFRLLKGVGVPLRQFELTTTFYSKSEAQADDRCFVVTPFRKEGIAWASIFNPSNLMDLLRLRCFMKNGDKFMALAPENDPSHDRITFDQFLHHYDTNESFRQRFLAPFISAGWGVTFDELKGWSADHILRTISADSSGLSTPVWTEIEDGTGAYIQATANQYRHSKVILESKINHIFYNEADQTYTLVTPEGETRYDHLVIATPAHAVQELLKDISTPEVNLARSALSMVHYFDTNIILHGDVRLMPADKNQWSVINIRSYPNGDRGGITMYKKWRSPEETPIFKSWQFEGDPEPSNIYARAHFKHLKLDREFLLAHQAVEAIQGKNHLWFAGAYLIGDRHENAIQSAYRVAKSLSPYTPRVRMLEHD